MDWQKYLIPSTFYIPICKLYTFNGKIGSHNVFFSVPKPHLASEGTYGLDPLLRGYPSLAVGQNGLLMNRAVKYNCLPSFIAISISCRSSSFRIDWRKPSWFVGPGGISAVEFWKQIKRLSVLLHNSLSDGLTRRSDTTSYMPWVS